VAGRFAAYLPQKAGAVDTRAAEESSPPPRDRRIRGAIIVGQPRAPPAARFPDRDVLP
jgi:hypothetical protein